MGLADPGPPRGAPHQGRRDHHRPARPGLASAVGMAMAQRRQRGLFDPDATPGESVFDHHVCVIASDGDLEEGVTSEASSLAGHQQLGNLIVFYDDNQISIEDDTDIAFSEDVAERYEAYGWEVVDIDWRVDRTAGTATTPRTSTPCSRRSTKSRGRAPSRPLVRCTPSSLARPDQPRHRQVARLRARRRRDRRDQGAARLRPGEDLRGRPRRPRPHPRGARSAARPPTRRGTSGSPRGASANPSAPPCSTASSTPRAARRLGRRRCPSSTPTPRGWPRARHPARCSARWPPTLPELWGGSADLAESNNTTMAGEPTRSSPTASRPTSGRAAPTAAPCTSASASTPWARSSTASRCTADPPLRRHLPGLLRLHAPRGAPGRADAAAGRPTSGPTTRSASARTARPTSRSSTSPRCARSRASTSSARPTPTRPPRRGPRSCDRGRPAGLALSRQNLPVVDRTEHATATGVAKGGYVLVDAASGEPRRRAHRHRLRGLSSPSRPGCACEKAGVATRVVSMPCLEWFEEQAARLPRTRCCRPRSAPASASRPAWRRAGTTSSATPARCVCIEHFGASADCRRPCSASSASPPEAVVKAAKDSLAAARKAGQVPP